MRAHATLGFLATVAMAAAGCAGDKGGKRAGAGEGTGLERRRLPADDTPAMAVENELGVLETADVEEAIQGSFDEIRGCYQRAGKAQRYANGKVLLRFAVAGDGSAEEVLVVESNLGNYRVERCLVQVGRRITFKPPTGGKATTFDYPVEFRSTNEVVVQDVDGLKIDTDLEHFMPRLAACGQLGSEDVAASAYIEPNGFPGSVGLASAGRFDEAVAACMVETIRTWKMSAVLPGRVLRFNFNIPPVIAAAEPAPPKRGAWSASARRRRR